MIDFPMEAQSFYRSNADELIFYVSPKQSHVKGIGTKSKPFSSIETARNYILENKRKTITKSGYRILLLAGRYEISDSFILSDKDSGTLESPVIYEAEEPGKVIFSGSLVVPSKLCRKIGKNNMRYAEMIHSGIQVYCVDLTKILSKQDLQNDSIAMTGTKSYIAPTELYINGEVMQLARYPNNGFAISGSSPDSVSFHFADERMINWMKEPFPMIRGYLKYGWFFSFNQIAKINPANQLITLCTKPIYGIGDNRPFYMSNILSEMDVPGEYYIDYKTSILYFILPQGVKLAKSKIELSNFGDNNKSMIEIQNASNIIFRNIIFENGKSGAINIVNSSSIKLSDIDIRNMGNNGINASGVKNTFRNIRLCNLGGSAIILTGGSRQTLMQAENLIENCIIRNTGRIQRSNNGAISIAGVGNTVRNCQISNLSDAAILFSGNDNIIEKNEIFNVCNETCDAGAIYSGRDWGSQGNLIQFNYIHDIRSINKQEGGVHAIYLDYCASGIIVKANIVQNIDAVGILIGGGRDNVVKNNIISNCGTAALLSDMRGIKAIVDKKDDSWNLKAKIENLNYKSEIWSLKYPKLAAIFDTGYENAKLPFGNEVRDNIMWQNKVNYKENNVGTFSYFTFSNNKELSSSPFQSDTITNWKFELNKNLPTGFLTIPVRQIGLYK